jgi:hypothetical protein
MINCQFLSLKSQVRLFFFFLEAELTLKIYMEPGMGGSCL